MSKGNGTLKTAEVAEFLGVSVERVRQLGREGRLNAIKPKKGYSYLWAREEVERYADRRRRGRAWGRVESGCVWCGMLEDVRGGLCWLCRLEEREPWHKRAPAVYAPAVRRGRLMRESEPIG